MIALPGEAAGLAGSFGVYDYKFFILVAILNWEEMNLLQGLYLVQNRADKSRRYRYNELRWLIESDFSSVKSWINRESFPLSLKEWNAFDAVCHNPEVITVSRFIVFPYLQTLQHEGFIRILNSDNDCVTLTLAAGGLRAARSCSSRLGRFSVWYDFNKDKFPGFILTSILSFVFGAVSTWFFS